MNRIHGMRHTKIYAVWCAMKARCKNKQDKQYKNYGGRGITVCDRWKSFKNFYEDIGEEWQEGLQLDRIDNDEGYYKENCRWATHLEQARNTRKNVWIEYNGEKKVLREWAREIGLSLATLQERLDKWSVKKALGMPKVEKRTRDNNGKFVKEKYDG